MRVISFAVTSPARPSPSTGQNTSAVFSPAAAIEGMGTPTREEPRPTTSGTGSSPARRSSPASLLRFPLTWTAAPTRPTSTVPITSFGTGSMCTPGVKRPTRRGRRSARSVGAIRPAPGIGTTRPLGAHDAYSKGAKVSHNGKKWTSDSDGNVWEPGVYGWTEYVEPAAASEAAQEPAGDPDGEPGE